ncbi:MAG: alpha-glucan phosphorylase [Bacteroidetes bacterium]|nr:MAG: alpha-glucan phosphorylase [Bacteroidota bacterium]
MAIRPDFIFEVSWEVCNKVGGIHTVVGTKVQSLLSGYDGGYVAIGPDLYPGEANPEFEEVDTHLSLWAERMREEGLPVRAGRWRIEGAPVVVLVDFTYLVAQKDYILRWFWDEYGLDSLQGHWDYVEPVLFGYAAGEVIESLVENRLPMQTRVVAQFHEWMTGSGVLFLKDALPEVATVFTTHATVLGRSIAGNGLPLYEQLEEFNADQSARDFQVVSKQSMERISAEQADAVTTVSAITARECRQFLGKEVDAITTNGFDASLVGTAADLRGVRTASRRRLLEVAHSLVGAELPKDVFMVGTGGRYEFTNKGLDVLVDALASLNASLRGRDGSAGTDVLACLMIPAGNNGVRPEVRDGGVVPEGEDHIMTHYLSDLWNDPLMRRLGDRGLRNAPEDRVKVMFVPCYLDGADGAFDMPYYDLLAGMDMTVFCSNYEPWGYTPLESLAFSVPTVTSDYAGFGSWLCEQGTVGQHEEDGVVDLEHGAYVVERAGASFDTIVERVARVMLQQFDQREAQADFRRVAKRLAGTAAWKDFVGNYWKVYGLALERAEVRMENLDSSRQAVQESILDIRKGVEYPAWRRLVVELQLPEGLQTLDELAHNLWWSWHPGAQRLFASISPELWEESERNPLKLLSEIDYERLEELRDNESFMSLLAEVKAAFDEYMGQPLAMPKPRIGYFSMEYGLHSSLKLYSGGLGILAGDYLKEASDRNIAMVGVGLLYRYGYFVQRVSMTGQQEAVYNQQKFMETAAQPVRDAQGNWVTVQVGLPGRQVCVRVWKVMVGRIPLYLLDTDFEGNDKQDKSITHYLYGGDRENRFKQEMVLGVGGVRALQALGCEVDMMHLNEGHAAFAALEAMRHLMQEEGRGFAEAMELVRARCLFTTHTPVPAGHDTFEEEMVRVFMSHYPARYGISWERFIGFGRVHPGDGGEKFSMSNLAANFSNGMNGVSRLHGDVSKAMFEGLWPGYYAQENHVGYVTNGVHYPTWIAQEWRTALGSQEDRDALPRWERVNEMPDAEVWALREGLRGQLVEAVKEKLQSPEMLHMRTPREVVEVCERLRPDVLTIGFARRFATYKRAHILLRDLDRLASLLNREDRPVQLLFAGKAHPHDGGGQDLIKRIYEISLRPEFRGKLLFLPNYDMPLAKSLVRGVDVWMNTPTRMQEASGTSGMKAVMNGGLHFSVLDGWWVEGYREGAGWALPEEREYANQDAQDELDAERIYSMIENDLVPLFYDRDAAGVPTGWVRSIRRSMTEVAPDFSSTRMQADYFSRYYTPMYERLVRLLDGQERGLKELTSWKLKMLRYWGQIHVVRADDMGVGSQAMSTGTEYRGRVVLDLPNISPEEVGVELVIRELKRFSGDVVVRRSFDYKLVNVEGTHATYEVCFAPSAPGAYDLAIRLFPRHELLSSRTEFPLVRWI